MVTNQTLRNDGELNTVESFTWLHDVTNNSNSRPWDHSDPFFSAHTRDLIKTVFKCYVRQVLVFIGIPGNIISCLVFLKQGLSDKINLLLFWLAVADLGNLLRQVMFFPGCYLSDKLTNSNWTTVTNVKLIHASLWIMFTSEAITVTISLDRCLSVAMPIKARSLITYRPVVVSILLSYLVPFILYFTAFLAYDVGWRVDGSTNRSVAYMTKASWFPMDGALIYQFIFNFSLVIHPMFLIVVIICCIITIYHLRLASRKRSQMTQNVTETSDSESKINKMLLFLCVVYVVLILPQIASSMVYTITPEYYVYRKYHNTFVIVQQMFAAPAGCINSSVNFFAYVLLSSTFRRALKGTMQGCLPTTTPSPPPLAKQQAGA